MVCSPRILQAKPTPAYPSFGSIFLFLIRNPSPSSTLAPNMWGWRSGWTRRVTAITEFSCTYPGGSVAAHNRLASSRSPSWSAQLVFSLLRETEMLLQRRQRVRGE